MRKRRSSGPVVKFDVDEANYLGTGTEGVYYQVGHGPGGWYVTAVADAEHFAGTLFADDGPYSTRTAACEAGLGAAMDWLYENGIRVSAKEYREALRRCGK